MGHGHGGHWQGWTDNPGWGGRRGHGGPPPWLQGFFGMGAAGAPSQQPGPKVRRGDVRMAIIDVLRQAAVDGTSVNGYQVIQQIAERSNDAWRPSPGSVYPTIQQLQDEGLVESDDERGRRTLRLTATGEAYAEEHAEELTRVWAPFERRERPTGSGTRSGSPDLKAEIGQVMGAVWQIVTQGSDQQRRAAVDTLVATRRELYGILADGAAPAAEPDIDDEEEFRP
ncbi:PadR family transcriptional regulator [Nocardioides sp. LHG3406-4]|uniref:PadR family transcriptional regulator n=1 Tax=Nocardioides sp. LHG3406-4 TaxID=2804575 RepID=UPI003CE7CAAE